MSSASWDGVVSDLESIDKVKQEGRLLNSVLGRDYVVVVNCNGLLVLFYYGDER